MIGVACGLVPGSSAEAQTSDAAQSIQGRVQDRVVEGGETVIEPVAGVRIIVENEAGDVVGEAVTDDDGRYVIPLQEPGTFTVRIDQETMPEGLTVEDGRDAQIAEVAGNQNVTRVFFLGEDTRNVQGKWSLLPQTLANGLKLAMIIGITSIGLSLIFGTTGLSNFAHGEMVTFGAFVAFVFNSDIGWYVVPATLAAVVVSGLFGAGFERGLWRPLRRRSTSLTSMMIVSIGVALALRYLFLYLFGGSLSAFSQYTLQPDPISLGPIDLPPRTLFIVGLSAAVIVGVALFLLKARFGKAIRAVSDNPDLASSSGIDTDRVILVVWVLGGALAGLGGVFYGLEFGIKWDMGFTLLLLMFAAVTLGGLGNPFGALLGSLVIGIFVELWTWVVPNANDLKTVGALAVLIVVLLVKPQGLLGSKERIG
ncbi:MAG TPA: branched-chain amino acid ABC transporter permease [Ilumatobacteraceae bacterium]|nr:branched-chain amino acid ABC transporter permease [Ilumatobacteraceae bacterium]